jgi:AraC family transcriptional regulator of adaptative response/methylated-DNA-[protein]-cysteine methyltransferase
MTSVIRWAITPTEFGPMLLAATDMGVCRLSFGEGEAALLRHFPTVRRVEDAQGLADWLAGARAALNDPAAGEAVPLDLHGTPFQLSVWNAVRQVPAGETRTYAQIAAQIGRPSAIRAVGTANGANPVSILIPCHRLIRSDGGLGGYAWGLEMKRTLLQREKAATGRT